MFSKACFIALTLFAFLIVDTVSSNVCTNACSVLLFFFQKNFFFFQFSHFPLFFFFSVQPSPFFLSIFDICLLIPLIVVSHLLNTVCCVSFNLALDSLTSFRIGCVWTLKLMPCIGPSSLSNSSISFFHFIASSWASVNPSFNSNMCVFDSFNFFFSLNLFQLYVHHIIFCLGHLFFTFFCCLKCFG